MNRNSGRTTPGHHHALPRLKPKLLAVELWGVGDLTIASPFLRQATTQFEVTVLAKSFALDLQARFWPEIKVVPFEAPWTAFSFGDKYQLFSWPWTGLARLVRQLRQTRFEVAVSARWDPRDHLLLKLAGARRRLGFPRVGSSLFLTQPLALPDPTEHRYAYWRTIGQALGLELPPADQVRLSPPQTGQLVLVHSGAGQPVRVWPLERYQQLVSRLRRLGYPVRVLCNPEQRDWWLHAGETAVATPASITELLNVMAGAGAFIGNDSGPGHLAAFLGIPTFTLFGPQVPGWFVPLHPAAVYVEGKACPYKPCSDYCRFPRPHCLENVTETEVCAKVGAFLQRQIPAPANGGADASEISAAAPG
jgi:ADP-heptose:LPS heptosyltransferase